MPNDVSFSQLDAYMAGIATPAEREAVERWIDESPDRRALLASLREIPSSQLRAWDVDAAWARLAPELARNEPAAPTLRSISLVSQRVGRAWRIAAVLVVAVGGGALFWQGARPDTTERVAAADSAREVASPAGRRTTVRLGDGSLVILNGGSRLRYTSATAGPRDVTLDGEGYFDVRHDANRPFRVHARGRVAEDVGTRFVVSAYPDHPQVDVAVSEGAVRVLRADDPARASVVRAGMMATIAATGAPVVSPLADGDRWFAWTRGVLRLDDQPLREAIPAIERWYDVRIVVADSALAGRHVSASFERETAQQALAAIALALDASSRQSGTTFTLSPRER